MRQRIAVVFEQESVNKADAMWNKLLKAEEAKRQASTRVDEDALPAFGPRWVESWRPVK